MAKTISGFMSEEELLWLAEQARTHGCIVEIGSYLGRSTRALVDNTPGLVYAIDDWYGPRDTTWLTDQDRSEMFDRFLANMNGTYNKVIPVISDHGEAKIDSRPDMVFIDGDHTYENVKRDIERWLPVIVPGGTISGHDADAEGVVKAVTETFGRVNVAPGTNIWWEVVDAVQ